MTKFEQMLLNAKTALNIVQFKYDQAVEREFNGRVQGQPNRQLVIKKEIFGRGLTSRKEDLARLENMDQVEIDYYNNFK